MIFGAAIRTVSRTVELSDMLTNELDSILYKIVDVKRFTNDKFGELETAT